MSHGINESRIEHAQGGIAHGTCIMSYLMGRISCVSWDESVMHRAT